MNIFEVLSQGKSRLHEPSVSAMLGYLLNPMENHGLGDIFIREFLKMLDENSMQKHFGKVLSKSYRINALIELEVQYGHLGKRNDIDIQIQLLDQGRETHRILIENKIRESSASTYQLNLYYNAVLNDEDYKQSNDSGEDLPCICVVFLTPDGDSFKLKQEFDSLVNLQEGHSKLWVNWTSENSNISILHIIRNILDLEVKCEINPINEYMRHTLKGFVNFISDKTSKTATKKMRTGQDIGDIIDEVEIKLNSGKEYVVVRRDSTQIQVFDKDTDDKQIARHIMSEYIDENNIDIPHNRLNTRSIGKKLLEFLESEG